MKCDKPRLNAAAEMRTIIKDAVLLEGFDPNKREVSEAILQWTDRSMEQFLITLEDFGDIFDEREVQEALLEYAKSGAKKAILDLYDFYANNDSHDTTITGTGNDTSPSIVSENRKVRDHKALTELLHTVYRKKNKDYGDSFGQSIKTYGINAALVRMSDKWNRLNTLLLKNAPAEVEESVTDTLLDLANYALMTALELQEFSGRDV